MFAAVWVRVTAHSLLVVFANISSQQYSQINVGELWCKAICINMFPILLELLQNDTQDKVGTKHREVSFSNTALMFSEEKRLLQGFVLSKVLLAAGVFF